jgi:integrating conjugative element protein (TIGR03759 family)
MIEPVRHTVVIALLAVSVMPAVAADPTTSRPTRSATDESALEWSELAPSERIRAEHWNLSETQWRRYRSLMEGIRGSISPATLSPIEVLGIHARDDAERRRYAEQWAVMMREDAQRILAFQRAYDAAARQLFAGEPLISLSRLADRSADRSHDEEMLRSTDRVLSFVRPDCTRCDAVMARLVARIDRLAGIDVYLSGVAVGDEQAIRDWAVARGIQPDWVRTRKVTLNFEAGALGELAPGRSELPVLMRRRGESVSRLPESAL